MAFEAPREVLASALRNANGQSALIALRGAGRKLALAVDVTAKGADVDETLDLTVEWSFDGGATWTKAETADAFAQITAVGRVVKVFDVKAPHYRIAWTVGGTTPEFTFSIDEYVT